MIHTLKSADWFPTDGFSITVERRDPQKPFPPHKHEFSELVIVTGGKGLHVIKKESWPLSAGDVFVVGGMLSHAYRDLAQLQLINILFQPEKLRLKLADLTQLPGYHALFALDQTVWRRRYQFKHRLHLTPQNLAKLLALVDELDAELKHRTPSFAFMATAIFMQLIAFLARCYEHSQNPDSRKLPRIAEVISHLESNPDNPVRLDDLAKVARMSKRSLLRTFRDATGATPVAYGIQLRIQRAAILLQSTTEPIMEVAFRSGFADSNYFTRQFRKLMGVSPQQYRQRYRK
jgi:AraC family L-rhamnose operon transcriptional activator RhaR/AraC family L-rhamnose operon regulatory protein RhaS